MIKTVAKVDVGLAVCLCTFECWHCRQEHAHFRTSELMLGQTKCAVINFCVALIPGCERECNEPKTILQKLGGMYGREVPIDTSHSNLTFAVGAGMGLSDKDALPCVHCCKVGHSVVPLQVL